MIVTAAAVPTGAGIPAVWCCVENTTVARILGGFLRWRGMVPKKRMALRMIKDVIRLKWETQFSHVASDNYPDGRVASRRNVTRN